MFSGIGALPLKKDFLRLMQRAVPSFVAQFFVAPTAAAARTALGAGATGSAVFLTATAADARTAIGLSGGVVIGSTLGTLTATTSGTSIDFTGIPAGVKRVKVLLVGVSLNGTDNMLVQIGDSGGIEATGYLGASASTADSAATSANNFTTGFGIRSGSATNVFHGSLTLDLVDAATNTWVASGIFATSNTGATIDAAGSKSLSATLDRVRLTTAGGANTFDAGSVNIVYE